MDEYINREEREQLLKDSPFGQRSKNSDWKGRMEKLIAGESLILQAKDRRHAHILSVTARQAARERGIKLTIRRTAVSGELRLVIWLAD